MFSHIMVGCNDPEKAKTFYDSLLATLGVKPGFVDRSRVFWRTPTGVFCVSKPIDGNDATFSNGGTIGFACDSAEQVHAWHDAGVAAGGTSIEDPPGLRNNGMGPMYLAYLRDPEGHKLCAIYRPPKEA